MEKERERGGERRECAPKKLDSFLRDQKQRRRASVLREVSDKERAPHYLLLLPLPLPRPPSLATPTNLLGSIARDPGARNPPPFTLRLFSSLTFRPLPPSHCSLPSCLSFFSPFRPIIFVLLVRGPKSTVVSCGALGTKQVHSLFAVHGELAWRHFVIIMNSFNLVFE